MRLRTKTKALPLVALLLAYSLSPGPAAAQESIPLLPHAGPLAASGEDMPHSGSILSLLRKAQAQTEPAPPSPAPGPPAPAPAQPTAEEKPRWNVSIEISPVFDSFRSNRAAPCQDTQGVNRFCGAIGQPEVKSPLRGEQSTGELTLSGDHGQFKFRLSTSYVDSLVKDGPDQFRLNTLADTAGNLTWSNFQGVGWGIELGGNLDLPTGRTKLTENELKALPIDDVAKSGLVGQGFNYGPSLKLLRQIDKFTLGVGGSYKRLGRYDPTKDTPGDAVKSGDEFTGTGDISFSPIPELFLYASPSFTATRGIGTDSDTLAASGSASYRPGNFVLSADGSFSTTSSSRETAGVADFLAERRKELSAGERWSADLKGGYTFFEKLTLLGRWKLERAFFESGRSRQIDRKDNYGLLASLKMTEFLEIDAEGTIWRLGVQQPDENILIGNRMLRYDGWQAMVKVKFNFTSTLLDALMRRFSSNSP